MPSLLELSSQGFRDLDERASQDFDELNESSTPLKEEMNDSGLIHSYEDVDAAPASVVTVDGACVVQQLAGIDLIDICAVTAEGIHGPHLFASSDSAPKYYWGDYIRDHVSSVSSFATTAMGMQEMMLLENSDVQQHDLRIIDGSWTSALLPIALVLQRDVFASSVLNRLVLDMYRDDSEALNIIHASIQRRLRPWLHAVNSNQDASQMISVSKSDSRHDYPAYLTSLGMARVPEDNIGDRNLASVLLEPGEMLPVVDADFRRPRESQTTDARTRLAGERAAADVNVDDKVILDEFYAKMRDVIDVRTGSILNADDTRRLSDEKWLQATYFKPANAGPFARPIRVEFARPVDITPDMSDFRERLTEYAKTHIIKPLSYDIVAEAREPLSQHFADREAKVISTVSKLRRESLISTTTNERFRSAIIDSYRT